MTAPLGPPADLHLRPVVASDLPAFFEMQCDPAGNQLAGTKPRDRATFDARWAQILRDPVAERVTPRSIIADGAFVGSINIFPQESGPSIGYWISREHWGRGIATRAIALILAEVDTRPLFAHVITHNVASRRALERNGFVVTSRIQEPETDRYVESECFILTLLPRS